MDDSAKSQRSLRGLKRGVYRWRRILVVVLALAGTIGAVVANPSSHEQVFEPAETVATSDNGSRENDANGGDIGVDGEDSGGGDGSSGDEAGAPTAVAVLEKLEIKGRAPKTGYTREEFYKTWPTIEGCSLRQRIIRREVGETAVLADDKCTVTHGSFVEPYTGKELNLKEKAEFSKGVQIDHVVALSDAWQKGAQNLSADERYSLATDPLNLLAVDSSANQGKSDGDAATWLPPNKGFRCQYVARQVSVKYKYRLWVTEAEHDAIARILETCPAEPAVGVVLE